MYFIFRVPFFHCEPLLLSNVYFWYHEMAWIIWIAMRLGLAWLSTHICLVSLNAGSWSPPLPFIQVFLRDLWLTHGNHHYPCLTPSTWPRLRYSHRWAILAWTAAAAVKCEWRLSEDSVHLKKTESPFSGATMTNTWIHCQESLLMFKC